VTNDHHEAITADRVLIATGSRPAHSPAIPVDGQRIFDTDALPHLQTIPRELIVVGASVIGLEYASIITALHRRVTVIDQRPVVLEFADGEIVEALCYQLRRRGATLRLGETVTGVRRDDRGHVVATLASGKTVHGDALVYAVGREANTASLNLGRRRTRGRHPRPAARERAPRPPCHTSRRPVTSSAFRRWRRRRWSRAGWPSLTCSGWAAWAPTRRCPGIYHPGSRWWARPNSSPPVVCATGRRGALRDLAKGQMIGDDAGFLKVLFDPESLRVLACTSSCGAAELIHIGQTLRPPAASTCGVMRSTTRRSPKPTIAALQFNRLSDPAA
jgi:NAD(P) transhydrogenase